MKKVILILISALLNVVMYAKVSGNAEIVGTTDAYMWYPECVTFLSQDQLDSVLEYSCTDIVPVKFDLYKTTIKANAQLDSIVSLIKRVEGDERVKLAYVWVGGSASPDGPLSLNTRLADKRGKALYNYLTSHLSLSTDKIRYENLGEDWYSITEAIELSSSPYKDSMLEIIKSEKNLDKREIKLKRLAGGKAWTWLKQNVLPQYRNARMVIVCTKEDIKIEKAEKAEPVAPIEPDTSMSIVPEIEEISIDTVIDFDPVAITSEPVAHLFVAAKTNLLFLAGTVANLGVEIGFAPQWSIDLPVYYSPYNISSDRKLRVLATQPEIRYWLSRGGEGHFFGFHGHIAGFNVALNDNGRYQDAERPLWGLGLGYGYALNFGKDKHWGLEFNVGVGFANYKYDKFYNLPNGQKCGEGEDWYYGLTRAGVTLTYKWWIPKKSKSVDAIVE